jgi:hypothetical protein
MCDIIFPHGPQSFFIIIIYQSKQLTGRKVLDIIVFIITHNAPGTIAILTSLAK